MKLPTKTYDKDRGLIELIGTKIEIKKFLKSTNQIANNSKDENRTLAQNRTFHGDCMVVASYGGFTAEEWKIMIKIKFQDEYFPIKKLKCPMTGKEFLTRNSTKDLTKEQFISFVKDYRAWFQGYSNEFPNWYDSYGYLLKEK